MNWKIVGCFFAKYLTLWSILYPGELFMSLKARLNDSNKNLVMMTLATVGTIATAMGPAVEKHSKVSEP
jgi:hypothetical protein